MGNETVQLTTRVILAIGCVGYPLAFLAEWRLRRWLGAAGQGWIRATLNALVGLLAVLTLLFALSLGSNLGWFRGLSRGWGLALSFATIGALALAPWALSLALHLWRRRAIRREWERQRAAVSEEDSN